MNELYKNFKIPTLGQGDIQPKKQGTKRYLPYAASIAGSSAIGGVLAGDVFKTKTLANINEVVKTPEGLGKYFDSIIEKIKNNSKDFTDTEKEVIQKLGMHTFEPLFQDRSKILEVEYMKSILNHNTAQGVEDFLANIKETNRMRLNDDLKEIIFKYFDKGDSESKAILNKLGIFDDFLTKYIGKNFEGDKYEIGCMWSSEAMKSAFDATKDSAEFIENYLAKGKSKEEVLSGLKSLTEKFSDTTMISEKVVPITKFNKKAAAIGAVIMAIVAAIAAKIVLTKKTSQKNNN